MINLYISFDGLAYTIPVNPKDLTISQAASNSNIDIIGLGKATRKGEPGLRTLKLQSFFPNPKSRYYYNVPASTYIEFIEKIWNTENLNNNVAHISSYGIKNDIAGKELDMYFVIEKFDYKYVGGDFDTEYTLSIKEYRPYGVKVTKENFTDGMMSARVPSTVKENIPQLMEDTEPTTEAKTYTIKSGDNLWSIAKRCTGDGKNWSALYELNKDLIGGNASLIYSGQVLTLPENWNSPEAKTNINTSAKVQSGAGKKQPKPLAQVEEKIEAGTPEEIKESVNQNKEEAESAFSDSQIKLITLDRMYNEHKASLSDLINKMPWNYVSPKNKVSYAMRDLQGMYDNARKISADPNKSAEEKAKAINDIQLAELRLYSRTFEEYSKYVS